MKQRVMIAIALVGSPSIVIADEPTTSLDVTIEAQILDVLKNLQKTLGTSIILITHDLGVIAKLCDRVLVMYGGKIVERGSVDEIFYDTATSLHKRTYAFNCQTGYSKRPQIAANRRNTSGSVCTSERMSVRSKM